MEKNISVIVPVRNQEDKIEQCLGAIFSQSYPPREVILVDGHSSDGTIARAKQFPVKILYEDYHTRGGGCQVGVDSASGDYIAFTDGDCIPDKNWLANLLIEFKEGVAGVGGKYEDVGEGLWTRSVNLTLGTLLSGAKSRWSEKKELTSLSICGANGMVRRDDILRVGGFNVSLTGAEDLELGHRLNALGKLVYTPDAVVLHDHSRGLKDFARQSYRYGAWRRESRLWGLQTAVPIVPLLLLLSLFFTRWLLAGAAVLYIILVAIMGIRFALQRREPALLFSIPIAYLIEHGCYTVGFWKEVIRPRKKITTEKRD